MLWCLRDQFNFELCRKLLVNSARVANMSVTNPMRQNLQNLNGQSPVYNREQKSWKDFFFWLYLTYTFSQYVLRKTEKCCILYHLGFSLLKILPWYRIQSCWLQKMLIMMVQLEYSSQCNYNFGPPCEPSSLG